MLVSAKNILTHYKLKKKKKCIKLSDKFSRDSAEMNTQKCAPLRPVGEHQRAGPEVRTGGNPWDGSGQRGLAGNLPTPQVEGDVVDQTWRPTSHPGHNAILVFFPDYVCNLYFMSLSNNMLQIL